jgi:hypothetical protein
MNNLLFIILLTLVSFFIFYSNKEKLNNTMNIELDQRIRKLDNENKIINEIEEINEDEIKIINNKNIKIHPYPDSSQNFIYVPDVEEALIKSDYIDDAYNLMIGELRQNISKNQLKNIQGKIKSHNVENKVKLYNPVFYRFGQQYYNFQDIKDFIIRPNYKIKANYL